MKNLFWFLLFSFLLSLALQNYAFTLFFFRCAKVDDVIVRIELVSVKYCYGCRRIFAAAVKFGIYEDS